MTNMSFNRFRVQEYLENSVNCNALENWHSYRGKVEAYVLPHSDEEAVQKYLLKDGEDLFYKGLYSLSEGIAGIAEGRHSWSSVKLYYSVFYFLRSSLASKGYAVIKNKCQYIWEIRAGKTPEKRNSNKYRNDHIGIVNIYDDIVGVNDLLMTNSVNGKPVYLWLMELRHQVHYRQRDFLEPDFLEQYHKAELSIKNSKFSGLIDEYYEDKIPIFCFDSEHASIAAPIKRASITRSDIFHAGLDRLSSEKLGLARDILKRCLSSDCAIFELFDATGSK